MGCGRVVLLWRSVVGIRGVVLLVESCCEMWCVEELLWDVQWLCCYYGTVVGCGMVVLLWDVVGLCFSWGSFYMGAEVLGSCCRAAEVLEGKTETSGGAGAGVGVRTSSAQ